MSSIPSSCGLSKLFRFKFELIPLLTEWLVMKAVRNLDSALTNKNTRYLFLTLISMDVVTFDGFDFMPIKKGHIGSKIQCITHYCEWLILRSIKVKNLVIKPSPSSLAKHRQDLLFYIVELLDNSIFQYLISFRWDILGEIREYNGGNKFLVSFLKSKQKLKSLKLFQNQSICINSLDCIDLTFPALEELSLNCIVDNDSYEILFACCRSIKKLTLSHANQLQHMSFLPSFTTMIVENNKETLSELNFSDAYDTSEEIILSAIHKCKNLSFLGLSNLFYINTGNVIYSILLNRAATLIELNIRGCKVNNYENIRAFLAKCTKVKRITLSRYAKLSETYEQAKVIGNELKTEFPRVVIVLFDDEWWYS